VERVLINETGIFRPMYQRKTLELSFGDVLSLFANLQGVSEGDYGFRGESLELLL
jgi:hypothetical protein